MYLEFIMDISHIKKIDKEFILNNSDVSDDILTYLFKELNEMSFYYPEFYNWLTNKVLPGLMTGERSIILEHRQHQLAGVSILKDTIDEKKLCCLRVLPAFQGKGVGIKLFDRTFEELVTESPLLSISEETAPKFQKILNYYGFKVEEEYPDYYRPSKTEYSFNGILYVPESDIRNR